MDNNRELEALNNCLNYYNLTGYKIHEWFQQDKRRTKQKYCLYDDKGTSLTGAWYYLEINRFIGGYGKACNEYDKLKEQNNSLLEALKECQAQLGSWQDMDKWNEKDESAYNMASIVIKNLEQ